MRHVELVIFENDSIMHEKALSLPIGKVSFRQLGVILAGILVSMVTYFVTKDFIAPGVVLAIFLGLGLVNTKIMSPDQMIKANLIFLIRGTSLKTEKVKKVKEKSNRQYTKSNEKVKLSILSQIIPQLESLFVKQNKKTKSKDYSIKIELTKDNQLKIIPTNNNTDLTLLQERINIISDDAKTNIVLKNNHMSISLDKSSNYDIFTIVD